jgi:hypothetical protein
MIIPKRCAGLFSPAASARSKDVHMSLGRNEPCHCGSGKKYKKCCLSKDEESRQEKKEEEPGSGTDRRAALDDKIRKRKLDPRVEAGEALWREFSAADYQARIALFMRTLDDPELMDAELAFEMLNEIFRHTAECGERDRFDALVEELRNRRPEIYDENKAYLLRWRITNALAARGESTTGCAHRACGARSRREEEAMQGHLQR